MRIKSTGSKGVQDLRALRRYGSGKRASAPKEEPQVPSGGAMVELSPKVKELNTIRSMADRIPDVDEARVVALKEQIQSGEYEPDLDKVAEGIIEEALTTAMLQED